MKRDFLFKKICADNILWENIDLNQQTIYQTRNWLLYFQRNQIKFSIYEISTISNKIGFIVVTKRSGFLYFLAGSPLEATGTGFQGICFYKNVTHVCRYDIYISFFKFFHRKNPFHCLIVKDFNLNEIQIKSNDNRYFKVLKSATHLLDLQVEWGTIYSNFSYKSCKYALNKAKKYGLTVEVNNDANFFSELFYSQLLEVYSRKNLRPTYTKNRILNILNSLDENNRLMCLCRMPDGEIVASAIFLYTPLLAAFYGGASKTAFLKYNPNEILMVYAIENLKNKQIKFLDFGGGGYTRKYCPNQTDTLILQSKYGKWNLFCIKLVKKLYKKFRTSSLLKYVIKKLQ